MLGRRAAMMEQRLIDLIGRIYDAAIDPEVWKEVLESVAEFLRADSTALQVQADHTGFALSVAGKFPLETLSDYAQGHVESDPRFQAILQLGPGRVATSEMLVPMREFERTAVYADFFRKWDLPFVVGGLLFQEPGRIGMFVANRSKHHGDFDEVERKCLQGLFPHLRRALEIYSRLGQVAAEKRALMESVDLLPVGLILVDGASRVIELNEVARRIVNRKDGLSIHRGVLSAARSDECRELHRIVGETATQAFKVGDTSSRVMRVSRPSFMRELAVLIVPVSDRTQVLSGFLPSAMVLVSDPEEPARCCPNTLRDLFGFTRAESRLAALLAEGLSLQESAGHLGVSYQTVRNQLKSIFSKTGTSSQSSLIGLLLQSPAALIRKELDVPVNADRRNLARGWRP